METTTLRPCPFCNYEAVLVKRVEGFLVRCNNNNLGTDKCPVEPSTDIAENTETAIEFWNGKNNS